MWLGPCPDRPRGQSVRIPGTEGPYADRVTDEESARPRGRAPSEPAASHSVSLERGLRILSAFTGDRTVLGIADLARAVGLNKSTTHRYVATLTALEYLEQDQESRKYFLGP